MSQGQSTTAVKKKSDGFTDVEKAAMKARTQELKAAANKEDAEKAVVEKIAELQEPDRGMAKRIHDLIKANAPSLSPKLWYGMPAYAKDDKIVCFYQSAQKFKTRYSTFGFNEAAHLDEGALWPVAFALTKLTPVEEARIIALVKKAVS